MLTKTKVKEQIENLPEHFSLDDLVERLILIEKIDRGDRQSQKGEVISEDQLNQEIDQWFE